MGLFLLTLLSRLAFLVTKKDVMKAATEINAVNEANLRKWTTGLPTWGKQMVLAKHQEHCASKQLKLALGLEQPQTLMGAERQMALMALFQGSLAREQARLARDAGKHSLNQAAGMFALVVCGCVSLVAVSCAKTHTW